LFSGSVTIVAPEDKRMLVARRGGATARWVLFALFAVPLAIATPRLAAQGIPDRLTDAEFWKTSA